MVEIEFDNIFAFNPKYFLQTTISEPSGNHLEEFPSQVVVATDASVRDRKAGVGIFFTAKQ